MNIISNGINSIHDISPSLIRKESLETNRRFMQSFWIMSSTGWIRRFARDNCRLSAVGTGSVFVGSGINEVNTSQTTSPKTKLKEVSDSPETTEWWRISCNSRNPSHEKFRCWRTSGSLRCNSVSEQNLGNARLQRSFADLLKATLQGLYSPFG